MDVGAYIRNKQKQKEEKSETSSMEEAYRKYSGLSEEQLLQELFSVANSSNVSGAELDDFYKKVKPFLTKEQSEKMQFLIMQLKGGR